jgi:sugar lactone lactonase YvrE
VFKFPPNSNSSTNGTIVAGTGTPGAALNQLDRPSGIYVDESDNDTLYVADVVNDRVMKWLVNATSGIIVAGGNGSGTAYTNVGDPVDVFLDSVGSLYVSDYNNNRVMKWPKGATNGTLVVGTGTAGTGSTELNGPSGIDFDIDGNLYVVDYVNNRVQRFMLNNTSC